MKDWFLQLSVMEYIYFGLAAVATLFLIVQIIMLCFSGVGDMDLDGDGDIDADPDSGVSLFTTKSLTAFFAVGGWAGLAMCAILPDHLQGLSILVACILGCAAMLFVVYVMRKMMKLQCNGAIEMDKLVGKTATVYVSIPEQRTGKGKVTLEAQGKFSEFDAMTDQERLPNDCSVDIIAVENECLIVKRHQS